MTIVKFKNVKCLVRFALRDILPGIILLLVIMNHIISLMTFFVGNIFQEKNFVTVTVLHHLIRQLFLILK